jgi:hypothetical protein
MVNASAHFVPDRSSVRFRTPSSTAFVFALLAALARVAAFLAFIRSL